MIGVCDLILTSVVSAYHQGQIDQMLCHQGVDPQEGRVNVSKFSSLHKQFLKESFVFFFLFVVIQSLSVSNSFGTPWTAAC